MGLKVDFDFEILVEVRKIYTPLVLHVPHCQPLPSNLARAALPSHYTNTTRASFTYRTVSPYLLVLHPLHCLVGA